MVCTFGVYNRVLGLVYVEFSDFAAIDRCILCMWSMLWFVWRFVVELGKCVLCPVVHRDVCITLLVITIKVQYAEYITFSINCYLIMIFE